MVPFLGQAAGLAPDALIDPVTTATAVGTLMGAALVAVGGYKVALGVGKKIIAYFGGHE